MSNPYENLEARSFWRSAVASSSPLKLDDIYRPKWEISSDDKIATAGSCFAQHVGRYLKLQNYNVLDLEPAPAGLPKELHKQFGYSTYSCRYGNIYTVRQLLQLAQEAFGLRDPGDVVWEKDGRFFDALRIGVEPNGLSSAEIAKKHREIHLQKVAELFRTMDVFVFTMGLTESWISSSTGTAFPTAPGVIAGDMESIDCQFYNQTFEEIKSELLQFIELVKKQRSGEPFRVVLTVSPVPLTATASGKHVLVSNGYSKGTLRSVAGELSDCDEMIDYFPSFEIVTSHWSRGIFFENNLRSVTPEAVNLIMNCFFKAHNSGSDANFNNPVEQDEKSEVDVLMEDSLVQCEDILLDAFAQ